ncbi:MAG: hypothetical protein A2047_02025 [Omnitrophica bacterium GWA2_41_15]|nr:MAG: hypothetical protein A2047_02025 [Omnitrophica bacterium GWA2_41_15]
MKTLIILSSTIFFISIIVILNGCGSNSNDTQSYTGKYDLWNGHAQCTWMRQITNSSDSWSTGTTPTNLYDNFSITMLKVGTYSLRTSGENYGKGNKKAGMSGFNIKFSVDSLQIRFHEFPVTQHILYNEFSLILEDSAGQILDSIFIKAPINW